MTRKTRARITWGALAALTVGVVALLLAGGDNGAREYGFTGAALVCFALVTWSHFSRGTFQKEPA